MWADECIRPQDDSSPVSLRTSFTMEPFPIGSRVFFLEGGKTRTGTVVETETIEGLRFVCIKIDGDPEGAKAVKLPVNSVSRSV
ncbi:hypothetical protein OH77DRAFT_1020263 [Trametes cingulata]|nr:hypothetical protein OH77DRAFT_1020263 [Trametes cingulata]